MLPLFLSLKCDVCFQILGSCLTFLFIIKIQNAEQKEYDDVKYFDFFF